MVEEDALMKVKFDASNRSHVYTTVLVMLRPRRAL
jgi:hypothetical protein